MRNVDAPLLQLGTAMTPSHVVVQTSEQLQELTASFANATAAENEHDDDNHHRRVRMDATVDKTIDRATLGRFFAEALGVNSFQSGVLIPHTQPVDKLSLRGIRALAVHKDSMTPQRFACLFSALPHTRSLHTLRLEEASRSFPWKLKKLELSWLAYALLHPETRFSSWRRLVVGNCKLVGDVTSVLQQMGDETSRSKLLSTRNLAALMRINQRKKKRKRDDDTSPSSSHGAPHQLQLACIKKDAVVRVSPDAKALPLVIIQSAMDLEMCAFRSEMWRCVLVPGFGFGWVHQGDVLEEKDWEPELSNATGCSSLTHLELGYPITMAKALLILVATGRSLESLVLESFGLPSSVLDDVSRLCPGLKSLGIKSSRISLSRASLQRYFSQHTTHHLRSLALSWSVCNHTALLEILSNSETYKVVPSLKELRLDKVHYIDRFAAMLEANRTLERLRIDQWGGSDASQLLTHHGEILPSAKSSIAFLSVITQLSKQNGGHVVEKISKDLLVLIFGFAAVQRDISILTSAFTPWINIARHFQSSTLDANMKPMKPTEPALVLVDFHYGARTTVITTSAQLEQLEDLFRNLPLECRERFVACIDSTVRTSDGLARLGQFFATVLQMHHDAYLINSSVSPNVGKLQELHIDKAVMDNHRFACLFSALPYARSIHTVHLSSDDGSEVWNLSALELSWITYAIFHPESKTSSWRKLMFIGCELVRDAEYVLALMQAASHEALDPHTGESTVVALGNSDRGPTSPFFCATKLAALMGINHYKRKRKAGTAKPPRHQRDDDVTIMRIARIKANTVVRTEFENGAPVLVTLTSDTELEICDFQFDSWLCVLVPGFGFGWIREHAVVKTRDVIPVRDFQLSSSLTAFGLEASFTHAQAVQFLSILGGSLESLYLDSAETSSDALDDVSSLCPSLKSLVVAVIGGRELSVASLKRFFSRSTTCSLESFTTGWQTCRPAVLIEILTNENNLYQAVNFLKVLYIRFIFGGQLEEYADRIGAMLESNQVLEQVYLSGSTSSEEDRTLEELWNGRLVSRKRTRNYRLGLLSVLAHDSAKYPALSTELIAQIFGFVWDRRTVRLGHPPWDINF